MNLLLAALGQPWAIEPTVLRSMADIVERHAQGVKLSAEEIEALQHPGNSAPSTGMTVQSGVAVIPIQGVIARFASLVNGVSQPRGTSVEAIRADFQAALKNPDVHSIVLDVDSPGGTVAGIPDLADEIAASSKPVSAYTDGMMGSAAYWLCCGAEKIYASRTAQVGSIGVYAAVQDTSVKEHNAGVRTVVIGSGPHKGAGMPGTPVTDAIMKDMAGKIDDLASMFDAAVAKGRHFSAEQLAAVNDGRVWLGAKALEKGLVDGIQSESQFAAAMAKPRNGVPKMKIEGQDPTPQPAASLIPAPAASAAPAAATAATTAQPAAPAAPAAVPVDAIAAARVEERTRISGLADLGKKWPSHQAIVDTCIADGSGVSHAEHLILAAQAQINQSELARLRGEGAKTQPLGAGNAGDPVAADMSEAAITDRWKNDPEMQRRYSTAAMAVRWEQAAHQAKTKTAA